MNDWSISIMAYCWRNYQSKEDKEAQKTNGNENISIQNLTTLILPLYEIGIVLFIPCCL
jgi:hypothetical protein